MTGFYDKKQVHELTRLSKTQIDRLEKAGKFPRRRKLSGDFPNSRVGWLIDEVVAWLRSR